jgi:ATPase subunit of ABC transporter with duplicated ATPase domains
VRELSKSIRIGDAEEQEQEKRDRRRAERRKEEERRELERGGTNVKVSRKKLMERERKKEEDERRRQWDETKRREEIAAALPIHLAALEAVRRDRSKKMERDVHIPALTLLAPDNSVLLNNTEFRLVSGRRYGLVGRNGIGKVSAVQLQSANRSRCRLASPCADPCCVLCAACRQLCCVTLARTRCPASPLT